MKNEGIISKQSFSDFISVVYESCRVNDIDRAASKYVKIVFSVNTQSSEFMTYQEFRSLVVVQPEIINYLQLVDISEDSSLYEVLVNEIIFRSPVESEDSSPVPLQDQDQNQNQNQNQSEKQNLPIIDLKRLPSFLSQHPYVQNACKWNEKEQAAFNAFLNDIAFVIQDRNDLRQSVQSSILFSRLFVDNANYQNSFKKYIRLSSNHLLGTSTPFNRMEKIEEEDEPVEQRQPPAIGEVRVALRRR